MQFQINTKSLPRLANKKQPLPTKNGSSLRSHYQVNFTRQYALNIYAASSKSEKTNACRLFSAIKATGKEDDDDEPAKPAQ